MPKVTKKSGAELRIEPRSSESQSRSFPQPQNRSSSLKSTRAEIGLGAERLQELKSDMLVTTIFCLHLIPHSGALCDAESTGETMSWNRSHRKQRTGINGQLSTWQKINNGVSRGSVPEPALFVTDLDREASNEAAKLANFFAVS